MKSSLPKILLFVVTSLGLTFVLSNCGNSATNRARLMRDMAQVDQIIKACKLYAQDWDGLYPIQVTTVDGVDTLEHFNSSTEAFNDLIEQVGLGTEEFFYLYGNPAKPVRPNQDGTLTKAENCYVYVSGQTDSTPARSPLIANEMESPGVYGANHPWLKQGKAVIGYCGGQVKIDTLSSKAPGATVEGISGSGITDIFQEAKEDDDGRITGGLLAVPRANILLP